MPVNLLKYGLALIATAVIIFFSLRLALFKLKQYGILKGKKWKKDKEEKPPLQ